LTAAAADGAVPGRATPEGTARYAARFDHLPGHFRRPDDLWLPSLALGLRRGLPGGVDDLLYRSAVAECLAGGVHAFVTALSDRMQTSERALGQALRRAIAEGVVRRDEVVVVTGGGELTPRPEAATSPRAAQRDLYATYVDSGLIAPSEVVAGSCLSPAFLRDQIDRSRRNLGLETLDVYLVQEPEVHLRALGPEAFWAALHAVFEMLEGAVREGAIAAYGVASWNGLLVPQTDRHHLAVFELFQTALAAGSADHHFRALQLPYGLAAGESAVLDAHLGPDGRTGALLGMLRETGTAVFASAPLFGGRLVGRVPPFVRGAFPEARGDAACCLQFVRSTGSVTAAVVGMREPEHLEGNLGLLRVPPADPKVPLSLFEQAGERDG